MNVTHDLIRGIYQESINIELLVIESSYLPKKIAPNYLTWNFTEMVMNAYKVNPENLVAVC